MWEPVDLADPAIAEGIVRLRRRLDGVERIIGWKVGWNDPAARQLLGVRTSMVGYAVDQPEGPPRGELAAEVELAVVVDSAGGIAAVAPAIEVIDIVPAPVADIVAGNLWHHHAVVSASVPWRDGLLDGLTVTSSKNGRRPRVLDGAADYAAQVHDIVAFVADGVAKLGRSLEAGQVVLTGNLASRPIPLREGDVVAADFGPLGSVSQGG